MHPTTWAQVRHIDHCTLKHQYKVDELSHLQKQPTLGCFVSGLQVNPVVVSINNDGSNENVWKELEDLLGR